MTTSQMARSEVVDYNGDICSQSLRGHAHREGAKMEGDGHRVGGRPGEGVNSPTLGGFSFSFPGPISPAV